MRVIHQGVTYHQPAPPGTQSVDVKVYDAAKKVEGVNAVADLMYLQAGKGDLAIMRLFAVDNTSQPPRTQMSDAAFEFNAPENAEIDEGQAQTAGGQWVNTAPVPQKIKGRYAFVFPLRPGQTQFRVTYHLTYAGKYDGQSQRDLSAAAFRRHHAAESRIHPQPIRRLSGQAAA